jgi:hypothetical protein
MLQQLSGVNIVLFIAAGIQTVLILFIFAKRQIMRFTLRSREGPHIPIGHDTKKVNFFYSFKFIYKNSNSLNFI